MTGRRSIIERKNLRARERATAKWILVVEWLTAKPAFSNNRLFSFVRINGEDLRVAVAPIFYG